MITVDCILCNKNLFPACPGPLPPAEWQVCVICAHPFVTLFILVLIQRLGVSVCVHVSLFIVSSLYVCSVICCWELFLSVRSVEQSSQDRMILLLSTTQKTAAYTIFMFRSAVILILITDLTTDTFTATFSFFFSQFKGCVYHQSYISRKWCQSILYHDTYVINMTWKKKLQHFVFLSGSIFLIPCVVCCASYYGNFSQTVLASLQGSKYSLTAISTSLSFSFSLYICS